MKTGYNKDAKRNADFMLNLKVCVFLGGRKIFGTLP